MEGTGLGLALVTKLVDDHGGIIDLDTGPAGTHSAFSYQCKRLAKRWLTMTNSAILVADDDRSIRQVLTQALAGLDTKSGRLARSHSVAMGIEWRRSFSDHRRYYARRECIGPYSTNTKDPPRPRGYRYERSKHALDGGSSNERGAFEYLPKPFDLNELISVVDRALAEIKHATPEFTKPEAVDELPLIGRSNAMQEIYRVMARLMTTDLTVLITGQIGHRQGTCSPSFARLRRS